MLLVYGTKASHLRSFADDQACVQCGKSTVVRSLFQKYAHFFYIPLFPTKKIVVSTCSNCQKVGPAETRAYDLKAKTPIWTFSGLLLLAAFLIYGKVSADAADKLTKAAIASPQSGDIFVAKSDVHKNDYGIFRVIDESNGALKVRIGNRIYSSIYSAQRDVSKNHDHLDEVFFSKDSFIMKEDMAKLKVERVIRN